MLYWCVVLVVFGGFAYLLSVFDGFFMIVVLTKLIACVFIWVVYLCCLFFVGFVCLLFV